MSEYLEYEWRVYFLGAFLSTSVTSVMTAKEGEQVKSWSKVEGEAKEWTVVGFPAMMATYLIFQGYRWSSPLFYSAWPHESSQASVRAPSQTNKRGK